MVAGKLEPLGDPAPNTPSGLRNRDDQFCGEQRVASQGLKGDYQTLADQERATGKFRICEHITKPDASLTNGERATGKFETGSAHHSLLSFRSSLVSSPPRPS
jgi:hypothetical protein